MVASARLRQERSLHGGEADAISDPESRVSMLRDNWKNHAGRVLWADTEWECPVEDGRWTLHTVRNVMGYSFFQLGMEQAQNYLGDGPAAIRHAYSGVSAAHTAPAAVINAARWDGREVHRPEDHQVAALVERLEALEAENERLRRLHDE